MDAQWQRCLDLFLQSIYDRSGSELSRRNYDSYLHLFFRFCDKSPCQVTRTDVLSFIQSPSSRGGDASAATKNQRKTVLNSFYRFASMYEVDGQVLWQKALPTQGMRSLKTDLEYRAMSLQELQRFFAAIPLDSPKGIRDRAMFAVYFWTARRRREIIRLTWGDIEPAVIVENDGTRRNGYIYRYRGKGKQRQMKTAELPLPAWNAIEHYLSASGRLATIQADEPLFISGKPGRGTEMNYDYVSQIFKAYCLKAGLDVNRLSLHSLRHTAAHERYAAGQDILAIQQLLGHASLDTTYRYLLFMHGAADTGVRLLEARFAEILQSAR